MSEFQWKNANRCIQSNRINCHISISALPKIITLYAELRYKWLSLVCGFRGKHTVWVSFMALPSTHHNRVREETSNFTRWPECSVIAPLALLIPNMNLFAAISKLWWRNAVQQSFEATDNAINAHTPVCRCDITLPNNAAFKQFEWIEQIRKYIPDHLACHLTLKLIHSNRFGGNCQGECIDTFGKFI